MARLLHGAVARIGLPVAAGGIVVAAGVGLILSGVVALRDNAAATQRSDTLLLHVIAVERSVVDAETGLRGYVITGVRTYLQPLERARRRLPAQAAALVAEARRHRAFVTRSQALASAARGYLSGYVPRVIGEVGSDPRAARSLAVTADGKRLVDGIRRRTATLEGAVSARQRARANASRHSADDAVTEAIVVLGLLVALTVIVGTLLGRLVLARERAAAHLRALQAQTEQLYLHSAQTARTLQEGLLPRELPQLPGCELAVRFTPAGAGDLVGGDFYDVFEIAPDRWAIVVADVCGKGAAAAAVTAMARWTLRSVSGAGRSPVVVLRALNAAMLRAGYAQRFITVAYMLVTVEADHADVVIGCGGHPPPIVLRPADGTATAVEAHGDLIGVWEDVRLHAAEVRLEPGETLVAYTDGVTGEEFEGLPVLGPLLRAQSPASALALATAIEQHAIAGRETPPDDIAVVALRFLGERAAAAAA